MATLTGSLHVRESACTLDTLSALFDTSELTPHGYCLSWNPPLVWLHVFSDGLIAASYYSIPIALIFLVYKRRDLAYKPVFTLFALFILACGTTHVFSVWVLWEPDYVTEGGIKALTAMVSVATAAALWPIIPQVLALPNPAQLRQANAYLEREISERQAAESAVRSLNQSLERRVQVRTEELREKNRQLEYFAYVASHDLREPIRMINSYLQLIDEHYGDRFDEDGHEFLTFAREGGERMNELTDGLLDFARLGSSKTDIRPVAVDDVLDEVMNSLHQAIDASGAEIRRDSMPAIHADRVMIQQVFQNLIENAIKYRSPDRPCRIHLTAEQNPEGWLFEVRDNGIGVPEHGVQRIFQMFQRLHTREEYPGTGMGLAICRDIVQRHGGRIWVDAAPEGGSSFKFTLGSSTVESGDSNPREIGS